MIRPRIGFGYDIHRLNSGLPLWLGGIHVNSDLGAVAHSDGDVIIHAIMDALLGAAGMRDIGHHFPDTNEQLKGIDSKILLEKTCGIIRKAGYTIGNIDVTLCLQQPKINNHVPAMITTLAAILQIPETDISIKATTGEKLGFVGASEGVECYATVLLMH